MFSWSQTLGKKEFEKSPVTAKPLLSSGVYQGEAKASINFFGYKAETRASVEATFVSNPQASNTFDVDAFATQTYVTPGSGLLFPLKNLRASGRMEMDEKHETATITGTIPLLSQATLSQKVRVNKEVDGYISSTSSLGPFFVSVRMAKKPTPLEDSFEISSPKFV